MSVCKTVQRPGAVMHLQSTELTAKRSGVSMGVLRTTGNCGLRRILYICILAIRAPNQAPVVLSKLQPGWAFGI